MFKIPKICFSFHFRYILSYVQHSYCFPGTLMHVCFYLQSDEVVRKAAYDILLAVGSSLRNSSSASSDGPYHKLINMVMLLISTYIINSLSSSEIFI